VLTRRMSTEVDHTQETVKWLCRLTHVKNKWFDELVRGRRSALRWFLYRRRFKPFSVDAITHGAIAGRQAQQELQNVCRSLLRASEEAARAARTPDCS
jgi:hypothetical protein